MPEFAAKSKFKRGNIMTSQLDSELFNAALAGNLLAVKDCITKGANVNSTHMSNATALYIAAQNGHAHTVAYLLKNNADPNIALIGGITPLHMATQNNHVPIVSLLLSYGADVLMSYLERTALTIAKDNGYTKLIKILSEKVELLQDSNATYDMLQVINLDKATEKWQKISKQLDDANLQYQKFSAIDGYKILVKNLITNEIFSGQAIKDKTASIESNVKHQIICNPSHEKVNEFNYLGRSIGAGELGVWCSNIELWKNAQKNNYKKIIILEDDVFVKTDHCKQKLENFSSHLPANFDLGYIGVFQYRGLQYPLEDNQYVNKFDSDFGGYGAWAIIYSSKAIQKLLSFDTYRGAIDEFLWDIALNDDYPSELSENLLEVYVSSQELLGVSLENSEITSMGRDY